MRENATKTKLQNGQAVFGVLSNSSDPTIAEICGFAGLDYYLIDSEHSSVTIAQVQDIVRACEVSGITPLARLRSNDPTLTLQYLDAGVMGIVMPGLNTADELEALVAAVKYPPAGRRGLGPVRAAEYLQGRVSQGEYVQFANDHTLVLPQLDNQAAITHLDELLTVEGVDGFLISPRDLAMSMGYYDGPGQDDVKRTIAGAVEKIKAAGKVAGTTAASGDQARALIDRGVLFCLNSVAGMLKSATTDFLKK